MNRIILSIIAVLFISTAAMAQSPEGFSYQAVVRDGNNNIIASQSVGMQMTILQGSASGTSVYQETFTKSTNANGLVNLQLGTGTVVSGNFANIDWGNGPYFVRTAIDVAGGTSYATMGTSQLMSVPYALYAKKAGNAFSGDYNDLTNKPTIDGSTTNELQTLSIAGSDLTISNGNTVTIPASQQLTEAEVDNYVSNNGYITVTGTPANGDVVSYNGTEWVAKGLSATCGNTGGGQPVNNIQPYLAVYHIICLEGVFPSRSGQDGMIAEIRMFGGNFAPRTWAFCDGQLLPISQNQALFSLIGTIYGGDGRTTFALPDLRGRVAVHPGQGPGLSDYRVGQKGGSETNTLNVTQLPSHNHTIVIQ